jgi:hypothetical protein
MLDPFLLDPFLLDKSRSIPSRRWCGTPFLALRDDPAQPNAERDEIGTNAGLGLCPNPPRCPVVAPMMVRICGGERGLADTSQPMQRRDGHATFVELELRLDSPERVTAPHEKCRHADRMLDTANILPGKAMSVGAPRFSTNSRKRRRAASSGTPKSSQRRK